MNVLALHCSEHGVVEFTKFGFARITVSCGCVFAEAPGQPGLFGLSRDKPETQHESIVYFQKRAAIEAEQRARHGAKAEQQELDL